MFGADPLRAGAMTLDGKPYARGTRSRRSGAGVYLVPEDRAAESMLPGWSLTWT